MNDFLPKEIAQRLEYRVVNGDHVDNSAVSKIHHDPRPCEDCGMTVTDRQIHAKLRKNDPSEKLAEYTARHWALQCQVCKLMRNPTTGVFDIPINEYTAFLKAKFKQTDK